MKLVKITENGNGGWRYEPAPSIINTDGEPNYSPTVAQLNALGYYEMALNVAEPVEGKVAELAGYEVRDNRWHTLFRYVDAPPSPPKIWRKVIIWKNLVALNAWTPFRTLLESHGLVDGWNATNELQEDFVIGGVMTVRDLFAQVRQALPITDEQWTATLNEAEVR